MPSKDLDHFMSRYALLPCRLSKLHKPFIKQPSSFKPKWSIPHSICLAWMCTEEYWSKYEWEQYMTGDSENLWCQATSERVLSSLADLRWLLWICTMVPSEPRSNETQIHQAIFDYPILEATRYSAQRCLFFAFEHRVEIPYNAPRGQGLCFI